MDSSVDIIEVLSDGKYKLNEHEFQTIVSKAEECNDFAVISMIGPKYSGKTLLMNSLVKYLESEDKNSWPKDYVIEYKNKSEEKPVIQMWSKPFILGSDGHKTAVFLIDTSHVFQSIRNCSSKVVEDLIGLILTTSSTVVYHQFNLITGITQITDLAKNVHKFVENCESFKELFYLIHDWDMTQDLMESNYDFYHPIKRGKTFVQDQLAYSELKKYFKNIECCHLPHPGHAIDKTNVVFNNLEKVFLIQFSEVIKNRFLNISEMEVKRHPVSQRSLRPQELFPLIRSYVNKLNGDSVSIDFGSTDETNGSKEDQNEEQLNDQMYVNSGPTANSLEMPSLSRQELENLLTEKQNQMSNHLISLKNTTEEIVQINKALIDQKRHLGLKKGIFSVKENKNNTKLIEYKFREKLSQKFDSIQTKQLVSDAEDLLTQLNKDYDKCLQQLIVVYEKKVKNKIEEEFLDQFRPSFTKMFSRCKTSIIKEYENRVKQMHKTNDFLTKTYEMKLNSELTSREEKFKNILNIISDYLKEWEFVFSYNLFFVDNVLSEKHLIFKQKTVKSADSQDLNSFALKIIERLFIRIEYQNTIIDEKLRSLIKMFWTQFVDKLKSGFFNEMDVKSMFENFLNHTKNSVEKCFDLKGRQQKIIIELRQRLDSNIRKDFQKLSSDYLQFTAEAKSQIHYALGEAIDIYLKRMIESMAKNTSLKREELEAISSVTKEDAIKVINIRLETIKWFFNRDLFEFIFKRSVDYIADKIRKHEQNFIKIYTERQITSSFAIHFSRHNLFAGIYDTEFRPVLDKYGNRCRLNSIAISDNFLFGTEAVNHIQTIFNGVIDPYYDFMSLLFKKRNELTENEIKWCPLPLSYDNINNVIKVKIQNKINYEFNIESIIALKVLDIKSDAEKQLGNPITSAVFTVPTHYSIRERNVFRDVSTIAGLESVHILSEITAAAIGYSHELRPQTEINVLFVAINDFECDSAVCQLKGKAINYLSYFRENLSSNEKKPILKKFFDSLILQQNDRSENKTIISKFTNLLFRICGSVTSIKQFEDIVLIGDSKISADLKNCLSLYFMGQTINDRTHGQGSNIVVKGSAIFSKSIESNADLCFDITEVSFHTLYCRIKGQNCSQILINRNTKLGFHKIVDFVTVYKSELPITVYIHNKDILLAQFSLNRLPDNYFPYNYSEFKLQFYMNIFGELKLSLIFTGKYGNNDIIIDLVPIRLRLTQNDLIRDKEFIDKFCGDSEMFR